MALINCPDCNAKISDKVQECPKCGFAIGEMDDEKLDSLMRKKRIKKIERITNESFIAIILFAAGFTWLYWKEPAYASLEMYAAQGAIGFGVIWYIVNRVRLIIARKS